MRRYRKTPKHGDRVAYSTVEGDFDAVFHAPHYPEFTLQNAICKRSSGYQARTGHVLLARMRVLSHAQDPN